MSSRLHSLSALGQSVWIDYLSRDLIESCALMRAVDEDAVVGVTSNPTIFAKALSAGHRVAAPVCCSMSLAIAADGVQTRWRRG